VGLRPVWFGEGRLDRNRALPALRHHWPDSPDGAGAAAAEWRRANTAWHTTALSAGTKSQGTGGAVARVVTEANTRWRASDTLARSAQPVCGEQLTPMSGVGMAGRQLARAGRAGRPVQQSVTHARITDRPWL
jgi:hypothetical protein